MKLSYVDLLIKGSAQIAEGLQKKSGRIDDV